MSPSVPSHSDKPSPALQTKRPKPESPAPADAPKKWTTAWFISESKNSFMKAVEWLKATEVDTLMAIAQVVRMFVPKGEMIAAFVERWAGGAEAGFRSAMKSASPGLTLQNPEDSDTTEALQELYKVYENEKKEGHNSKKFFLSVIGQWRKDGNEGKKVIGLGDIAALKIIAEEMPDKVKEPEKAKTPSEASEQVIGTVSVEGKDISLVKRDGKSLFRMGNKDFELRPVVRGIPVPEIANIDLTGLSKDGENIAIDISTLIPRVPKKPLVTPKELDRVRTSVLANTTRVTLTYHEANKPDETADILFEEVQKKAAA